jgi:hypothetical protein
MKAKAIKREILRRKARLEVVECSPYHLQIRGGAVLVNYWPSKSKAHVQGARQSFFTNSAKKLVDEALQGHQGALRTGPVQRRAPGPRPPKKAQAVSVDAFGGPRCWVCGERITLKDTVGIRPGPDGRTLIHEGCRKARP